MNYNNNNNLRLKFRYYDDVIKQIRYSNEWDNLSSFFKWASKYAFNNDIQQFTGRQDKNGKDIYEGDLIEGDFDFGPAGFVSKTLLVHWHPKDGYQWNYWNLNTITIVNNIFQCPELLL